MSKQQDTHLRDLVDRFVADLTQRVHEQALETVRAALGDTAAPKRRGPGRPRKAGASKVGRPRKAAARKVGRPRKAAARKGGRRSAEDVAALGETLLAHIKANAGQRLEEIGRALRMATKELKRPISNLLEAGALRTEGQKRGTRYFAGSGGGAKRKAAGKKKAGKKAGRRKTIRKRAKAAVAA